MLQLKNTLKNYNEQPKFIRLMGVAIVGLTLTACFQPSAPSIDKTDTDGDGIYDTADNCIDIVNGVSDASNQVDTDEDGRGDVCDGAAYPAAGSDLSNDFDNDGWADDGSDNCPTVSDAVNNDPSLCTDTDGDLVLDSIDNCPDRQNASQDIAVCTDSDNDGVYNAAADDITSEAVDNCPDRANASQNSLVCTDTDGDNLYEAASDDDVTVDTCPAIVNPGNDADYCADPDGDGVYTKIISGLNAPGDNCPNDQNADQVDDDSNGVGDVCDGPGFVDNDNDGLDDNSEDVCLGVKRADNNIAACTDTDGDLVMDLGDDNGSATDNCPLRKNASQDAAVCNDSDNDNIYNAPSDDSAEVADNCPSVANTDQLAIIGKQFLKGDVCDDEDNDGVVDATDVCPIEGSVIDCDNQYVAEAWYDFYHDFMCDANDQITSDGTGGGCNPGDGAGALGDHSASCSSGTFAWSIKTNGQQRQSFTDCEFTLGQTDWGDGAYPAQHRMIVNGANFGPMNGCASCDDQGTGQINGNFTVDLYYNKNGYQKVILGAKVFDARFVYRKKVIANDNGNLGNGLDSSNGVNQTVIHTDCDSLGCVAGKVIYDTNNTTADHPVTGQQYYQVIYPGAANSSDL